jgi:predicted TIM-barrel fold metal-dependent hydrolase
MLDRTGMTHGVLVQVSVHGTDNSLMVESLRSHRERLRGIAVAPLRLSDRAYRELAESGVVGLRLNTLYGGGIGVGELKSYGALCREMGWHLQFLIDIPAVAEIAQQLARLPVPVVIDHMGKVSAAAGVRDAGFQTLVSLVRDGAWVKISGAYRITAEGPPYRDTVAFAQALLAAAPDRCVWGSDWPHVAHWGHMMNVGDLLDLLADWAPEDALRQQVLVSNPARLYGF